MREHETEAKGAHLRLIQGLKNQMRELDEEIARVARQQQEVAAAQETLKRMEAILLRMAMLAREAAAGSSRLGLNEEFEECKQTVLQLADNAEMSE